MFEAPPVLISLTSFGAAEVMRHGQLYFAELSRQAGADGVEVRGELLASSAGELQALRDAGNVRVYSSPEGLWKADGKLDADALQRALDIAAQLAAPRLKMSIGGFGAVSTASLQDLKNTLDHAACELVIENDQTPGAGTLASLVRFFSAADAAGLQLPMTFDVGNWHYLGECPLQAAAALGSRVGYVHAKGVQRRPDKWVAVPLAESAAPWRAVLRGLPADVPWAIEYPLIGDDLVTVTSKEIEVLRAAARLQLETA
ncbi:TIM barrel protein [Xylophilus rhododendri]|uniref:TIM barrel protein n=2 Tax=Xylophilus rhododendri TaxID=2697032 RepID=A0A857JC68_9BURK|nr:TIM barrel protein [Xylophilus rhododendri]